MKCLLWKCWILTVALALVLVPYIQSGDRPLASVYAVVFVGSALLIFFLSYYMKTII